MFWTAIGLIVASLIGFIILRLYGDPDGDDVYTETEFNEELASARRIRKKGSPRQRKRALALTILRYVTYILMLAGLVVFIVYGCIVD